MSLGRPFVSSRSGVPTGCRHLANSPRGILLSHARSSSRALAMLYQCPEPFPIGPKSRPSPQSISNLAKTNHLRRNPKPRLSRGTGVPSETAARSSRVTGASCAPAAVTGTPSAPAYVADALPVDGSMEPTNNPVAATPSPFPSLQPTSLPAWWLNSSPIGSNEGIYPQGGFTNFLQSNSSPENFHLVGNTRNKTTMQQKSNSSVKCWTLTESCC